MDLSKISIGISLGSSNSAGGDELVYHLSIVVSGYWIGIWYQPAVSANPVETNKNQMLWKNSCRKAWGNAISFLSVFDKAGVKAEIPADIQVAMWEKFTFITAISGVGDVTRAPVGVTRSLPETRQLLVGTMQEIQAVAEAYQIDMPPDYVSRTITFIDSLPEGSQPSIQRDPIARRPSELSDQNGAVVRLGRERVITTPINAYLYASLLPQEKRARGEVGF
jgi:ketopantoate reductase